MSTPVLREAYEYEIAVGRTPAYWEMNSATLLLFNTQGQDFCELPINEVPFASLGEWWLYPQNENDPIWLLFQEEAKHV